MPLVSVLSRGFSKALEDYAGRVHRLAEPLSDAQFWTKPYPYGNSFGHLVLHLTGNLNYYLGAQLAGTGYVRDRPREFAETARLSKEDVLGAFDEAVAVALRAVEVQTTETWGAPYEAENTQLEARFDIVLNCVSHLNHHVGQMIYLTKQLSLH